MKLPHGALISVADRQLAAYRKISAFLDHFAALLFGIAVLSAVTVLLVSTGLL